MDPAASDDELVLATPPHRRVWTIGTPEMLAPIDRGTLQAVVVRAERVREGASGVRSQPRPPRHIGGAY